MNIEIKNLKKDKKLKKRLYERRIYIAMIEKKFVFLKTAIVVEENHEFHTYYHVYKLYNPSQETGNA